MFSSARVGHALVMLGALDDDLVGADAGHHVVDAVAALVEAALDLQGGEPVGDDADPPAGAVGPRAEARGRRGSPAASCPRAPRRTGRSRTTRTAGVSDPEVVGPLGPLVRDDHPAADDRVFPQLGHDRLLRCGRISRMPQVGLWALCGTESCPWAFTVSSMHRLGRRESHLPDNSLEIGRGGDQLEDALARRPVEAGIPLEQLDVEADRVARGPVDPGERDGQLEDRAGGDLDGVPVDRGAAEAIEIGDRPRGGGLDHQHLGLGGIDEADAEPVGLGESLRAGPPSVSTRISSRSASKPNQTARSRPRATRVMVPRSLPQA